MYQTYWDGAFGLGVLIIVNVKAQKRFAIKTQQRAKMQNKNANRKSKELQKFRTKKGDNKKKNSKDFGVASDCLAF